MRSSAPGARPALQTESRAGHDRRPARRARLLDRGGAVDAEPSDRRRQLAADSTGDRVGRVHAATADSAASDPFQPRRRAQTLEDRPGLAQQGARFLLVFQRPANLGVLDQDLAEVEWRVDRSELRDRRGEVLVGLAQVCLADGEQTGEPRRHRCAASACGAPAEARRRTRSAARRSLPRPAPAPPVRPRGTPRDGPRWRSRHRPWRSAAPPPALHGPGRAHAARSPGPRPDRRRIRRSCCPASRWRAPASGAVRRVSPRPAWTRASVGSRPSTITSVASGSPLSSSSGVASHRPSATSAVATIRLRSCSHRLSPRERASSMPRSAIASASAKWSNWRGMSARLL